MTGRAYLLRLVLQGIYDWEDDEEARKLLQYWRDWLHAMPRKTGELLEPMVRAARIVEVHLEGILTH